MIDVRSQIDGTVRYVDEGTTVDTGTIATRKGTIGRSLLVAICGVCSVAVFFRYQIGNHFTELFSNRYDGLIVVAILEHWHNVFRGLSRWSQTNFFYPFHDTLGYQDAYFANGVFYSAFRGFGMDPFLASESSNMVLRAIGYAGAYFACRRIFGFDLRWALLAAVLFTISSSSFNHAAHIQLLSISFVPILALLLHGTLRALLSGRRKDLLIWGLPTNMLYAVWLMTGYYMAWYFVYFAMAVLAVLAALSGRELWRSVLTELRRQAIPLAALIAFALLVNLPFLSLYLPKIGESGQQSYAAAMIYAPWPLDIPNVSPRNLLYGRLVTVLHDLVAPAVQPFSERSTGVPAILLFLFGCAVVALSTRRSVPPLTKAMAVAVVLTWATVLQVDGYSLWYFVYHLVPGAKALRGTGRYQIFLAAPIIVVSLCYLRSNAKRIMAPVLFLVCALLVIEELGDGSGVINQPYEFASLALDRTHELSRLNAVPPPPHACKVFFASAARAERGNDVPWEDAYGPNVDSMLVAEYRHLPTINGLGAILPPHWRLFAPEKSSYLSAVASFVSLHHIIGLCALNLQTLRWDAMPRLTPSRGA